MKQETMIKALKALDHKINKPLELLIGGGAAMLLAHKVPLTTHDIDGLILRSEITAAELDPLIKKIAQEIKIPSDWYNEYFSAFTYTIPKDFRQRCVQILKGKYLTAQGLGKEDLLIMKCFAGREKDIGHARALIGRGANTKFVEQHLTSLFEKKLPGTQNALDFLDDLLNEIGEG